MPESKPEITLQEAGRQLAEMGVEVSHEDPRTPQLILVEYLAKLNGNAVIGEIIPIDSDITPIDK